MRLATAIRDRFTSAPVTAVPDETTVTAQTSDAPLFDEVTLARLRKLVLLSKRSVAQGLAGEHRSQRRGSSPEFADFKSYSQGDDFRRIDWNIYSRLDDLFVRLSEVTTELTIHMLLDSSSSMNWTSSPEMPTKFTYARQVVGSLAYAGLWHFDRVIISPFSDQLEAPYGPVHGRGQIAPMMQFLTNLPAHGTTTLGASIERYARSRKRPGILIVVSDLLSGEPDELQSTLRLLRSRGWQTTIVQIIDTAELNPAPIVSFGVGNQPMTMELIDLESQSKLRITPTTEALRSYQQAIDTWQQQIEQVCSEELVELITLHTDWPIDSVVLALLRERGIAA